MTKSVRESYRRRCGPIGGRAVSAGWGVPHALLAAALMAWSAAPAAAGQDLDPFLPLAAEQDRPPATATTQTKRLDLGVSFYDAFDMTSVDDKLHVFTPGNTLYEDRVGFGGANASLAYSQQTTQASSFAAAGGTGLRYYSGALATWPVDYYGGFNFSTRVNNRVRFRGSETASMSPYYTLGNQLLTDTLPQQIAPQFDQRIAKIDTVSSNTSAGMSVTVNRRSALNFGYSLEYVNTLSDLPAAENSSYHVTTQGANASYMYQTSRYMTVRAGYSFSRSGLFGQAVPSYDSHSFDGGIGYRKPLSFSRRSVLSFNVGSTLVTDGRDHQLYVTGDAALTHRLSQFWTAAFTYNRSVSRVGGVAAPFINDIASGTVGGLVTRHMGFSGSASYSRGSTAVVTNNAYDALYTSGRVTYTLTRYIPFYAEYIYYFYQFDAPTGLAFGVPLGLNRHGLRTGLSYSVPLIGRRPPRQ